MQPRRHRYPPSELASRGEYACRHSDKASVLDRKDLECGQLFERGCLPGYEGVDHHHVSPIGREPDDSLVVRRRIPAELRNQRRHAPHVSPNEGRWHFLPGAVLCYLSRTANAVLAGVIARAESTIRALVAEGEPVALSRPGKGCPAVRAARRSPRGIAARTSQPTATTTRPRSSHGGPTTPTARGACTSPPP